MQTESSPGQFWNQRFSAQGAIWGEAVSPTLNLALQHFSPKCRILEIGFGYGRDLAELARFGFKVTGIDPSVEGKRLALERLDLLGVSDEDLITSTFEQAIVPSTKFDAVLSHRMLHLMTSPASIDQFVQKLVEFTSRDGLICIGARDVRGLDISEMHSSGSGIYEYRNRPGHLIRFWSEEKFREIFEPNFEIILLQQAVEQEAMDNPVPCHLTIMLAKNRGNKTI